MAPLPARLGSLRGGPAVQRAPGAGDVVGANHPADRRSAASARRAAPRLLRVRARLVHAQLSGTQARGPHRGACRDDVAGDARAERAARAGHSHQRGVVAHVGPRISPARRVLRRAADRLGRRIRPGRAAGRAAADSIVRARASSRDSLAGPSLPLARYGGTYRDDLYGDATITLENGRLVLRFSHSPAFVGDLEHWQHDTFIARWRTAHIEDAYISFALRPDGSIEQFKMEAVSPLADFSFDYQDLLFKPVAK